jgi:hypothetical protein
MSCVCILTPVVIAAWPAFSSAVLAAAASLGYSVMAQTSRPAESDEQNRPRQVTLELENSEIVTNELARDQRLTVCRDGVVVTFSRDPRGRASICVDGTGQSQEELRALGEELGRRVVQQYVYDRLMEGIRARQFVVVEEETDETHTIRLKVRHWEN